MSLRDAPKVARPKSESTIFAPDCNIRRPRRSVARFILFSEPPIAAPERVMTLVFGFTSVSFFTAVWKSDQVLGNRAMPALSKRSLL